MFKKPIANKMGKTENLAHSQNTYRYNIIYLKCYELIHLSLNHLVIRQKTKQKNGMRCRSTKMMNKKENKLYE